MEKIAGFIYGPQQHHLDHIAPLCSLLEVPLIVTEKSLEKMATEFYPTLVVFYIDYLPLPQTVLERYDYLITALAKPMVESIFFLAETLNKKALKSVWCPHGNSDKGGQSSMMSALSKESAVCVYGNKMVDFIKSHGGLSRSCETFFVGNYRRYFFEKHKDFYKALTDNLVFSKFKKRQPTILYAPTWDDFEKGSSVHKALPYLLNDFPDDLNLIVKLHPNMLIDDDLTLKKLMWEYEGSKHVIFLNDFPLIYPLCEKIDLYIGDTSSIGYDFLSFDKPMLFLNTQEKSSALNLHKCGKTLLSQELKTIHEKIKESLYQKDTFQKIRKNTYNYTFSETPDFNSLKNNILKT